MEVKYIIMIFVTLSILIVGGIIILKDKPYTFDSEEQEELFRNMPDVPAIEFNGVTLFDSTNYNPTDNVCVGERYGMEITIENCFAQDIDGRDITHDVSFRWNGDIARNISWIFVYEHELESGSMSLLSNVSRQTTQLRNTWVSNYLIDKIVSYTAIPQPSYCDLGNLNNTQFYNVTRTTNNATTQTDTICFTDVTAVNATAFLISGNADLPTEVTVWEKRYVDITDRIDFLGVGLLDDERSYYQTVDVPFEVGQEYKTKWIYTPLNKTRAGKWHILGYDSQTGLIQSVLNDEYIYVDPWWNSSWSYKKPIYINVTYYADRTSTLINVTYDAKMKSDFSDLRFTDDNDVEIGHWFNNNTYIASNSVLVWVNTSVLNSSLNKTIYMYYGNAGASSTSDITKAFMFADDFNSAIDWTNKWESADQSKYSTSSGILTSIGTTSANGFTSQNTFSSGYSVTMRISSNNTASTSGMYLLSVSTTAYQSTYTSSGAARAYYGGEPVQNGNAINANQFYILTYTNAPSGNDSARFTTDSINLFSGDRLSGNGAGNTLTGKIRILQYLNGKADIDWVFVRGYVPSEPTYTFGAEEIEDDNYPIFTPASPSPANNTAYVSGATYTFETTITSTNGSAGLSFNGTNYTMTNSSTTFTRQLTDLGGGTYAYYYWAYGNGTVNRYNQSQTYSYTIARATSEIATYIEGDRANKNSINSTNLNLSTRLITGVGAINLYYNNTLINSGTGWISNITLVTTGNYTITGNYSGNNNYTSASESWNLTVLAGNAISVTTVSTSPPTPITYGTNSTWGCVNDYSLPTEMWVNGVNRTSEKGVSLLRGAGSYSINCSASTNVEYNITGSSQVSVYVINKATPTVEVSASPSNTENYLTETTVTGSGCPTQVTCTLTRAGTPVSNPDIQTLNAGTYLYNYSVPTNQNYSATSDSLTLTINKINPSMSLTFSPSQSVVNGTETTVTGSGCTDTSCVLTRNGVIVTNPETTTLAVGSYAYNYSFAGSTNYNAFSAYGVLSVVPVSFAGTNGTMNFTSTNLSNTLQFQVPYRFVTQAYMNLSSNTYNNIKHIGNITLATYGGIGATNTTQVYFPNRLNFTIVNLGPAFNAEFRVLADDIIIYNNSNTIDEGYLNISLDLTNYSSANSITLTCWKGAAFQDICEVDLINILIMEKAETTNLNITINNKQIYYYPGLFNQSNNRTNNFYNTLNSYLSTCSYTDNYCVVPITFNSSTAGVLNYSDVLFSNEGFIENSQNYSTTAYETENKRFTLNASYDVNYYTTSSASLIYGSTNYPATKVASGNNNFYTIDLDIPNVFATENWTFYWNLSLTPSGGSTEYYYSNRYNQTVTPIYLSLCNATNNVRYINFTFRDESTGSAMSAATDLSTWTYYLGNGTTYKTLVYTDTSAKASFAYCFTPKDRTLNTVLEYYQYSATGFPQRQYYLSSALTNTTTNQVLYLLNSSQGIYSTFITNNPSANVISGVTVQVYREISGSSVLISQGLTDSAGSVTFWVNPNYVHTIVFSKTGFQTQTLTVRPTQSVYTVIMGGSGTTAAFEQYLAGITWYSYPSQKFLAPNTTYTFGLNINAIYEDIVSCKVELLDTNNNVVNSVTGCSASGGNISFEQNTGSYSKLFLKFYVDVGNGLVVLDPIDYWIDATDTSSINTIKSFFESLTGYNSDFGASDARNTYTKVVAFFLVLTIIIAFLSFTTGADLTNPGWAVIIIYGAILLGSVAGFFTIDIFNVTENDGFNKEWINKYFIAGITGLYTTGFILSRFRRENA